MRTVKIPRLAMHGVLQKSVKFIKWKYMASLCAYDCGYNAWPTRCNVSRERSTLCVPPSSFFTHDKRLWNWYLCNNSIGFDNPHCMWKLVVYRGATLYPFWHRANLWAKVWVLYRTEFQRPLPGSIHTTNPNPLQLFVPVEVWDSLLAYTKLPPWDSACHQFFLQCVSNFNYRIWHVFRRVNT